MHKTKIQLLLNVVKYYLTQLTMWSKCYTCVDCCLELHFVPSIVIQHLVLFPQASSAPLQPYMRCEQPAAPVAKVGPLAMVNPQCMHHRGILLCGQQSVQLQIALPLPLYILVVRDYSFACLQSSQFILFVSGFFHSKIATVFIIIIIDKLISFQSTLNGFH